MGQIPIRTFWSSVCQQRWPIVAASAAAFVGTFLTIVVAGLYSLKEADQMVMIELQTLDLFNPNWTNSVMDDGNAAISVSLIENLNLSYPIGTFDELALPRVALAEKLTGSNIDNNSLLLLAQQPAFRAKLECERLPVAQYNALLSSSRFQQSFFVNASYELPPSCLLGGPGANLTALNFQQTFNFPLNFSETYFAKLLDLHVGPYDLVFGNSQGEIIPEANPDNPPGCPSIGLIYGHLNNETSSEPSISIQVCYQGLERIVANVTLQTTKLSITKATAIEDTASALNTSSSDDFSSPQWSNYTSFPFRVQKHFDTALSSFNSSSNPFALSGATNDVVDNFFQAVFFGSTQISIDQLRLQNSDERNRVFDGIHSFYRRYMAQAISSNMRKPVNQLSSNISERQVESLNFKATAVQGIRTLQLKQDRTSKWILQSMIAFMICSGGFAVWRTDCNTILPFDADPCTIWGQMRLWSNSAFCDADYVGQDGIFSQKSSQKQLKSTTVSVNAIDPGWESTTLVKRKTFRLGWWDVKGENGSSSRRYGIDAESNGS